MTHSRISEEAYAMSTLRLCAGDTLCLTLVLVTRSQQRPDSGLGVRFPPGGGNHVVRDILSVVTGASTTTRGYYAL